MERRRVEINEAAEVLSWPPKNPSDVVDCEIDWKLGEDRILTSKWLVPSGIAGSKADHDSQVARIWLSGGTMGGRYVLTNEITTVLGRSLSRSVRIKIKQR